MNAAVPTPTRLTPSTPDPGRPGARLTPTQVATDTFVVHDHAGSGETPVLVPLNALVIRAAEPVVVDTGTPANLEHFLADVFALVEPRDLRWVFVSHDDADHAGNLAALMAAAPNATVLMTGDVRQRTGATLDVPLARVRWVGDLDRLDVGDRTLVAVRPPVYDSPQTRGLFDPTTGVYWASDSFGSPVRPGSAVRGVDELEPAAWRQGMTTFDRYVAPWIDLVDEQKFLASVERIEALGASCITGAHTPVIGRDHVHAAIDTTRSSPTADVDPVLLDQIRLALTTS